MAPTKSEVQAMTELTIRQEQLATLVQRMTEVIEGTTRTAGMKEKITIAEYNIEANKQSFKDMQEAMSSLEKRLGMNLMESTNSIKSFVETKFAEAKKESDALKAADAAQQTFLDKIRPWVSGLQWLITIVAGLVVTMIITGKLHMGLTP